MFFEGPRSIIPESICSSWMKCTFSSLISNGTCVSASKEVIGDNVPEVRRIERGFCLRSFLKETEGERHQISN